MITCANCNNIIDGNYCYFCERLIIGKWRYLNQNTL